MRYPVLRSTRETMCTRLSLPMRVSPSKSPILPRRSTMLGLSSIRRFFACSRCFSLILVPHFLRYLPFCDRKYFLRCGARSLIYRYMVLAARTFCFSERMPEICSGDLCCVSSFVTNHRSKPRMLRMLSMATIRFIRLRRRTSLASYPSLLPYSATCLPRELLSFPIVRAISLREWPALSMREIHVQSSGPICVYDILTTKQGLQLACKRSCA